MKKREEDRNQFMPPEKRFDFNRMNRQVIPKKDGSNVADVTYNFQTIEQSA